MVKANDNALSRAVYIHNESLKKEKSCKWFALCGKEAVATRAHVIGRVPVCDKHAKFGSPNPQDIQPFESNVQGE